MTRTSRSLTGLMLALLVVLRLQVSGIPQAAQDDIDAYVSGFMASNRIPGVSLVATRGSEVVVRKGYGTAGPGRPMTADTPMFIGSQTKSFTALAVMQLVEAGKIELDAPIQRYIPWFKVADPQASAQITVRSLLNHTSGLSETGYVPNLPDSSTMEQAVRDLQKARPDAPVASRYQYFNPGYIVLGYLVEVIAGQSYGDYLRQHIFTPLGMQHSSAVVTDYVEMNIAQGFTQLFGFPVPMAQPVPVYYLPAGFIVSTADDLSRFLVAMENGGALDGKRVLSQASVDMMLTPDRANNSLAGFGWDITSYYGEKEIIHGGANEYFKTDVVILPQSGLTAAMIVNQDHMLKATYDYGPLFWGVVSHMTGRPIIPQQVSGALLGIGLLAAYVVILFFSGRSSLKLRKIRGRLANMNPGRRWLGLLPHAIFILATLVAVTIIGPSLAGRGFDMRWFIGFYPDVAILAGTVLVLEIVQVLIKVTFILRLTKPSQANPQI